MRGDEARERYPVQLCGRHGIGAWFVRRKLEEDEGGKDHEETFSERGGYFSIV